MSKMQELIAEHRRALSAFVIVLNAQSRNEQEDWATNDGCEVDVLLTRIPGAREFISPSSSDPASVFGMDEEDLRKQIDAIYQAKWSSLYWLEQHSKSLYCQTIDLLDGLRATNMALIGPAFKAWKKDRYSILKKQADLQKEWDKTGKAETEAAVALFRHPAANDEEEAMRAQYARETKIFYGNTHYGVALMNALMGSTDEQPQEAA